jgi:hypothetical protein
MTPDINDCGPATATPSLCSSWLASADLADHLGNLPAEEHAAEVLRIWRALHAHKVNVRRQQAALASETPYVSGQLHISMYSRRHSQHQHWQQRRQHQQEQDAADLADLYNELYILSTFARCWW